MKVNRRDTIGEQITGTNNSSPLTIFTTVQSGSRIFGKRKSLLEFLVTISRSRSDDVAHFTRPFVCSSIGTDEGLLLGSELNAGENSKDSHP